MMKIKKPAESSKNDNIESKSSIGQMETEW